MPRQGAASEMGMLSPSLFDSRLHWDTQHRHRMRQFGPLTCGLGAPVSNCFQPQLAGGLGQEAAAWCTCRAMQGRGTIWHGSQALCTCSIDLHSNIYSHHRGGAQLKPSRKPGR